MAVTNYYSFGGEIIGEETGGVRRDYLTDALGSVTATVTEAGAVENTYRYKPYGETLAKTGMEGDPKFLWVGKWGYRNNPSSNISLYYVRARHYQGLSANWTSIDLLWPKELAYIYAINNPSAIIDYSGLNPPVIEIPIDKYIVNPGIIRQISCGCPLIIGGVVISGTTIIVSGVVVAVVYAGVVFYYSLSDVHSDQKFSCHRTGDRTNHLKSLYPIFNENPNFPPLGRTQPPVASKPSPKPDKRPKRLPDNPIRPNPDDDRDRARCSDGDVRKIQQGIDGACYQRFGGKAAPITCADGLKRLLSCINARILMCKCYKNGCDIAHWKDIVDVTLEYLICEKNGGKW